MIGCKTEHLDILNLDIPMAVAGVDPLFLNPRRSWQDEGRYDEAATRLARMFRDNIAKFNAAERVVNAGPTG